MLTSSDCFRDCPSSPPKLESIGGVGSTHDSVAVIILASKSLLIIESSTSVEALLGYKPKHINDLCVDVLFYDEVEFADFKRFVESVITDGVFGFDRYYYLKHKDSSRLTTRICLSPANLLRNREPVLSCMIEQSTIPDTVLQRIRLYENCCGMIADISSEYFYYLSLTEDGHRHCEWFIGSLKKITGFLQAEVEQLGGWGMLIHPDDQEQITILDKTPMQKKPFTIEFRIIDRDGNIKHLENSVHPITTADNSRVVGILGVIRDKTGIRKLEHVLDIKDFLYLKELESLPVLLTKFNHKEARFTYWNRERNWSGYRMEEWNSLTNEQLQEVIHPDDRALIRRDFGLWMQKTDNTPLGIDFRVRRPDGELRWIETLSYKQYASDGSHVSTIQLSWDVNKKKRELEELKQSRELARKLASHEIQGREIERQRIAREIHDELGQVLTAFKFDVSYIRKKINRRNRPLLERALSMEKLVDSTIKTVKRLTTELHPFIIELLGLAVAIETYVGQFEERTGIKMDLHIDPRDINLDAGRSIVVYRIVQEALSNIARHSMATEAELWLIRREDLLKLHIQDNGVGFNTEKLRDPKSFGLLGMRERVEIAAGELKITSQEGKGTIIDINIPVVRSEDLENKGFYSG